MHCKPCQGHVKLKETASLFYAIGTISADLKLTCSFVAIPSMEAELPRFSILILGQPFPREWHLYAIYRMDVRRRTFCPSKVIPKLANILLRRIGHSFPHRPRPGLGDKHRSEQADPQLCAAVLVADAEQLRKLGDVILIERRHGFTCDHFARICVKRASKAGIAGSSASPTTGISSSASARARSASTAKSSALGSGAGAGAVFGSGSSFPQPQVSGVHTSTGIPGPAIVLKSSI